MGVQNDWAHGHPVMRSVTSYDALFDTGSSIGSAPSFKGGFTRRGPRALVVEGPASPAATAAPADTSPVQRAARVRTGRAPSKQSHPPQAQPSDSRTSFREMLAHRHQAKSSTKPKRKPTALTPPPADPAPPPSATVAPPSPKPAQRSTRFPQYTKPELPADWKGPRLDDWTNYKEDFPKKDMHMLEPGKPGLADAPVPALRDMYNPPPEKWAPHVVPDDWKGPKFNDWTNYKEDFPPKEPNPVEMRWIKGDPKPREPTPDFYPVLRRGPNAQQGPGPVPHKVPNKKRIDSTVYHLCVPPTPEPRDPRIPPDDFTRPTPFAKKQEQEIKPEILSMNRFGSLGIKGAPRLMTPRGRTHRQPVWERRLFMEHNYPRDQIRGNFYCSYETVQAHSHEPRTRLYEKQPIPKSVMKLKKKVEKQIADDEERIKNMSHEEVQAQLHKDCFGPKKHPLYFSEARRLKQISQVPLCGPKPNLHYKDEDVFNGMDAAMDLALRTQEECRMGDPMTSGTYWRAIRTTTEGQRLRFLTGREQAPG